MSHHPKLHEISTLIAELLGLSFTRGRWSDLERGVLLASKELGIGDSMDHFVLWFLGKNYNKKQLDVLANHLTVGETYFYREKPSLEIFQQKIIPELLTERFGKDQHINIWSAGCCSGEEPYTLAMILLETIPDISKWNISILATDLNPSYLKKAKDGIYTAWSFRETSEELKSRYFHKIGTGWQIDDSIRKMVLFKQLNLAEMELSLMPVCNQNLDVIFCRNVLMYFSPQLIRQVGIHFHKSLMPNGWFITSPVEMRDELFIEFAKVKFGNTIIYRKSKQNQADLNPVFHQIKSPENPFQKVFLKKKEIKTIPSKPSATLYSKSIPEEHLLESAEQLYRRKKYADCAALCRSEIPRSANKQIWKMLLARSCANYGQLSEAKQLCDEMLVQDRLNVEIYYLKATIHAENNDLDEAIKIISQGFYIYPDHLMSHILMVGVLRRMGNHKAASIHIKSIKRILSGMESQVILDETGGLTVGTIIEMVEYH